jgi:antitoxin ParD1/3/4
MSITLTLEQERIVQNLLATGKYRESGEVIQAALTLLEEYGAQYDMWIDDTRSKVEVGIQELQRGEGIELDVVMAKLRTKIEQARAQMP